MTIDPRNPDNSFAPSLGTFGTPLPLQSGVKYGAPGVSLPTATFNPVPAALPAGRVPVDISHTWDGVLHAIDRQGAPYAYDRLRQAWGPVGTGIDASARLGGTIFHFRGLECVTSQIDLNDISEPLPIAEKWQRLPRSFQLGVCGAASTGSDLYLFAQGRYVRANEPAEVFALADVTGWPGAPAWAGGAVDGTFSLGDDQVLVFRNGEWVTFSISKREVLIAAPLPLALYGPFSASLRSYWGRASGAGSRCRMQRP